MMGPASSKNGCTSIFTNCEERVDGKFYCEQKTKYIIYLKLSSRYPKHVYDLSTKTKCMICPKNLLHTICPQNIQSVHKMYMVGASSVFEKNKLFTYLCRYVYGRL